MGNLRMKKSLYVFGALIALLLTACGGGGGGSSSGSSSPAAATDAQGLYGGTSSAGFNIDALILENGEFYTIFSKNGVAWGLDYGTATGFSNAYAGTIYEFYIPTNTVYTGSIAGVVNPKVSISGATSFSGNVSTYTAAYNSAYDTPATLAALTGTYTGNYYTGSPVTMAISSTGAIQGTSTNCSFSGTAAPRSTGKYVYNVSLTFTGAACAPGAGAATGVAVLSSSGSSTYLYTAGLNSAKSNGFFWIGRKN